MKLILHILTALLLAPVAREVARWNR